MSMSQPPDYIVEEIYPQLPDNSVEEFFPELPDPMVEGILSCLPVPDLCRCRTVCKRWHSLIRSPGFGILRRKTEDAKPIVGFVFARQIRMKRSIRYTTEPNQQDFRTEFFQDFGWSFMDLTGNECSKVWHTVRRCEIDLGAHGDAVTNSWFTSGASAMGGGLVCEFLQSDRLKCAKVFVYNPIGKTQHVLPFQYSKCKRNCYPGLQIAVDNIAHTYKIYLMNSTDDDGTSVARLILRAYDSSRASSGWRTCSRSPMMIPLCSVIFEGMLYVMFYGNEPNELQGVIAPESWLFRYDPMADVWEKTHLHIVGGIPSAQLIVSDSRLFLVSSRTDYIDVDWWFDIQEIIFPGAELRHGFKAGPIRLPREIAWRVFDRRPRILTVIPPKVCAFGSFKCIILMSRCRNGILIAYDLVKRSFELLPSEPPPDEFGSSEIVLSNHMNVMNLVLPSDYPDGSDMLHNMNPC